MPRLVTAGRFTLGGVAVRLRSDRPADVQRCVARWLFWPGAWRRAAAGEPRLGYDLLLGTRRKRVVRDGRSIAASRSGAAADALREDLQLQLRARTPATPLHAGAVASPDGGGAVLLVGASGAGKSSLVAELAARGAGYLTDELVFLSEGGVASGLPRALHAWGEDGWRVWRPERVVWRAVPVTGVVLLETPRRVGGELEPVPAGEAAARLVAAAFRVVGAEGLGRLTELAGRVPVQELACEGVGAAADGVEPLLRGVAATRGG